MNPSEPFSTPRENEMGMSVGASTAERRARVLVLASEHILAERVRVALNDPRIQLRVARDQPGATALLESWRPDLAVIDIDIEQFPGIGTPFARLPVIALTRQGDLQTKLSAFDRGADEVLLVPFSAEELLARVRALGRRACHATTFTPVVQSGELELDMLRGRVRIGGAEVQLTPRERGLLYLLVANAGRVLSRDEILDRLWGADHTAESNVVDQHVRNLRAKVQRISTHQLVIVTVPGQGYQLLLDDSVDSSPSSMTEGPHLQYCRDVDSLQEFDFDRVQELDEKRAPQNLAAIAA